MEAVADGKRQQNGTGDQERVEAVRPARRPASARPAVAPKRRPAWQAALVALVLMAASSAATAFLVRRHYKAQEVVASVNGDIITRDEFYNRLEQAAGAATLRRLVRDTLVLQYAKEQGVYPSDGQVERRYTELSKRPGFNSAGRDPATIHRDIRVQIAEEAVVDHGVSVTEAEVQEFYRQNIAPKNPNARFYTPDRVQVAAIVTRTEAECRRALTALHAGMPFQTAARTYSMDPSKYDGGLLPPAVRGRMRTQQVRGLDDALFGLKIGDQIGPREFGGIWWIIRCIDRRPAVTPPFDQVREECRAGAMLTKGLPASYAATQEKFGAFQKRANAQAFWARYRTVVK